MTKRIILSPHLDDAVLSCGASIARWTDAGDHSLVMTVFAGCPADDSLSEFAWELHQAAGAGEDLMTIRRSEDQDACAVLGADYLHLEYLDAPYRMNAEDGEYLYRNNQELMSGAVHSADRWIVAELSLYLEREFAAREIGKPGPTIWYAPLGAGGHVDHILVHKVGRRMEQTGAQVKYYEDYPYVEDGHTLVAALARSDSTGWRSEISSLSRGDVEKKCEAIVRHESQLQLLFGSTESMQRLVAEYTSRAGTIESPAERFWSIC